MKNDGEQQHESQQPQQPRQSNTSGQNEPRRMVEPPTPHVTPEELIYTVRKSETPDERAQRLRDDHVGREKK